MTVQADAGQRCAGGLASTAAQREPGCPCQDCDGRDECVHQIGVGAALDDVIRGLAQLREWVESDDLTLVATFRDHADGRVKLVFADAAA